MNIRRGNNLIFLINQNYKLVSINFFFFYFAQALPQKVINRKSSHLQHFHLQQQEKQRFNDQNARMIRNERATSMYNKSLKNFDDLNRFNYNLKLKENSYEKINSNLNNNYFNNPLNYVLAH